MGWFSRRLKQPGSVPESGNRARPVLADLVPEQSSAPPPGKAGGGGPARGGRPVAEQPRTRRVSMSLTEAEHTAWTVAAEGARLSVWAREQVQHRLATESPGAGQGQELGRLRADLARVGSNLNQLMRAVNQGQVIATPELVEAVDALRVELAEVRKALP